MRPAAVDVASGVERAPGVKDPEKVKTVHRQCPQLPDRQGHFGEFGGRYVAETLMPALLELDAAYRKLRRDRDFSVRCATTCASTPAARRRCTSPRASPSGSAAPRST